MVNAEVYLFPIDTGRKIDPIGTYLVFIVATPTSEVTVQHDQICFGVIFHGAGGENVSKPIRGLPIVVKFKA